MATTGISAAFVDTNVIVATMQAYEVQHLLTHNAADFTRFAHLITVLPLQVV